LDLIISNKTEKYRMCIHFKCLPAALTAGCLRREKDLDVTSRGEGGYYIQDIAVVSPTRLLVTDNINRTLRLVNSQNGGVVSQVSVPGGPYGVCLTGDGRAAVTLPNEERIQFVRLDGDTLTLDKSTTVKRSVYGIMSSNNHLVVSYTVPVRVERITMEGRVTHELNNQTAGRELFKYPHFITSSHDGRIYVSDQGTHTITQLDHNLQVLQVSTSPTMKTPAGIVSVSNNQVIVAGRNSNNILVLDTTTGTMTPLLGQAEGIQLPWTVGWCPDSQKLYVGLAGVIGILNVYTRK